MSLPSGYEQLQYIEGTGTQYINSGFIPNNSTRLVMDIEPVSVNGTHIFGSRSSSSASNFFLLLCTGGYYRDDYAANKLTTTVAPSGRVTIDKNKNNIAIGETSYSHTAATFTGVYPIALLASNTGGTVSYFTKAKLYSCQIYDNGTLVRNFIPCKNAAGTVGLWDDVNSTFYSNAGTGVFLAGPKRVKLPSGYTQVEYLQGSGTQYIDTGLVCNKSDAYRYDVIADLTNNANYAGCNAYLQYQASIGGGAKADIDIVYQNVTETISVNGVQKSSQSWSSYSGANVKIGILKMGDANNAWYSGTPQSGKIYSCQIYKSGVLTRDFIPCTNVSGVAGLYDIVNSQFYTNAGTGTFTTGAEIEWPTESGIIYVKINGEWKQVTEITINIQ